MPTLCLIFREKSGMYYIHWSIFTLPLVIPVLSGQVKAPVEHERRLLIHLHSIIRHKSTHFMNLC